MPATVQELIERCLVKTAGISETKARIISSRFDSIKSFVSCNKTFYKNLSFVGGKKLGLSEEELRKISWLQKSGLLNPGLTVPQNFIKVLGTEFLNKQIGMIRNLKLEGLNVNPILVVALKLDTAESIVKFYVYQAASRSIVTSMGYLVQDLLIHSGTDIFNAKSYASVRKTKWDIVKIVNKGLKKTMSWIEVKSGPNDLDKTQILHYKGMIEEAEWNDQKAFIGETYGRRQDRTMTHTLYESYLDNWDRRTLIGKELWTFVSDDKDYPTKLLSLLKAAADKTLLSRTIVEELDSAVSRVLDEFHTKHGSGKDAVANYIKALW